MRAAFREAEQVWGKTLPNPPVGAILVKAGRIIGKGGTLPAGQSHAEIVALEKAGQAAAGATLYVTLEPCCHQGRTPPCTRALIAAGVTRVVAACSDPNPIVSGKGFSELRRAGIKVEVGVLGEHALEFYDGFFFFIRHGRPKIIVKIAQSPDGRINSKPGVETAITGNASRRFAHELRTRSNAILIGGQTLRSDDPDLTPRLVNGQAPEALILTRQKRPDSKYRLFASKRSARTVVIAPHKVLGLPPWVEQIRIGPHTNGNKALAQSLLKVFKQKGYHSVLLEGGRSVWTPFLNSGLCDVLYLLTGSKLQPEGERWDSKLVSGWVKSLKFHRFTPFGPDVLAEYRRE